EQRYKVNEYSNRTKIGESTDMSIAVSGGNGEEAKFLEVTRCTTKLLHELFIARQSCVRSVFEYYPDNDVKVFKEESFSGSDVLRGLKETKAKYNIRLWWTGSTDFETIVKDNKGKMGKDGKD